MRRTITPLFALGVFVFVVFGGLVVEATGKAIGDGHPGPVTWQWRALLALLGVNLVLLVGGSALLMLRRRRRP